MYENTLVEKFSDEELRGFRLCLAEEYRELDSETLAMMLDETLANMTPEEAEGFWNVVKKIGRAALPTVGAGIGTLVGGPAGTAIGGAIGKFGAKALAGSPKKATRRRRTRVRARSPNYRRRRRRRRVSRSSAVNKLLRLIRSPQFLQALASISLKEQGRKSINVGSSENLISVPTGAFLNLLESLANQAAMEVAQDESMIPSYLKDANGEALCDLANPDERAKVLLERLEEDESFYQETDFDEDEDESFDYEEPDFDEDEDYESDDEVFDWLEQAGLIEEPIF